MTIYIGLMSGTSMDGIDVALLDVSSQKLLAATIHPYPPDLKNRITAFMQTRHFSWDEFYFCHREVGKAFAGAVKAFLDAHPYPKEKILAIGSHGQTILHAPHASPPYSIQIGCAHTIAEKTGFPVVSDFRTRDLVCGGQGAPLAPLYHQVLFETHEKPVAILNIGGISNLTILSETGLVEGCDVGPGNTLLDQWAQQHLGTPYDFNGHWAKTGTVQLNLLHACLTDPFFVSPPPKSLDQTHFSLEWLARNGSGDYQAADVQTTLVAFTVQAIVQALQWAPTIKQLFVCGGGVHNLTLMETLQTALPKVTVNSTATWGVDPDHLEAMMCAWLAACTIQKKPMNLTSITGGKQQTLLGCIYPISSNHSDLT